MAVSVHSYTSYHSPNAYLGTAPLRRTVAELSGVELVRRPIHVLREHGPLRILLVRAHENPPAMPGGNLLDLSAGSGAGGDLDHSSAGLAHRADQRIDSPRSLIVDGIGTPPWPEWLSD